MAPIAYLAQPARTGSGARRLEFPTYTNNRGKKCKKGRGESRSGGYADSPNPSAAGDLKILSRLCRLWHQKCYLLIYSRFDKSIRCHSTIECRYKM